MKRFWESSHIFLSLPENAGLPDKTLGVCRISTLPQAMISILEVIQKTTDFFEQKGVPNPRIDAEWLVAHALGCKRLDLFLRFDKPLTEEELQRIRPLVKRRSLREPLQYIIGHVSFFDLDLLCDKRALIPRPETEELAEWLATHATAPKRVLDLGTGTGALALALAKAFPKAEVVAADISEAALSLAKENALRNDLDGRVTFVRSDWFESVDGTFDLIVSNPPYLTDEEVQSSEPEVKDHEPWSALAASAEGISDLKTILIDGFSRLNDGGMIACETGIAQHEKLKQIADATGYAESLSLNDLHRRSRFFIVKK